MKSERKDNRLSKCQTDYQPKIAQSDSDFRNCRFSQCVRHSVYKSWWIAWQESPVGVLHMWFGNQLMGSSWCWLTTAYSLLHGSVRRTIHFALPTLAFPDIFILPPSVDIFILPLSLDIFILPPSLDRLSRRLWWLPYLYCFSIIKQPQLYRFRQKYLN